MVAIFPRELDPSAENDLAVQVALRRPNPKLIITYAGSGDSGGVEAVFLEMKNVHVPLSAELDEKVTDWAYAVLKKEQPRFEINEGGYGSIVVDLRTRQVTVEHTDNLRRGRRA